MPRTFDRFTPDQDHSPLANLLDFSEITQTTDFFGGLIKQLLENLPEIFMGVIKEITGIDLSSPEAFLESIIEFITTGGPALELAESILDMLGSFIGIPNLGDFLSQLETLNPLALLSGFTGGIPILTQLIGLIPGVAGGLTGLGGLGDIFGDLFGFLGNPTGVGSGTPTLPGIGSIPILGGLLNGGGTNFLGSLIPGLDASKIISGTLGAGLVQPLIDAVSQGFGGITGLNFTSLQSFLGSLSFAGISFDDLIGLIPGIGSGLTGSGGLGSIFTDLFGLLGGPTNVGSGTPALPSISSIPILGGLLSGGNLLGSLIPGLDASKITTGSFPMSMITSLTTLLGGFGTGSSIITQLLGLIPNLAGSTTGLTGLGDVFTDLFSLLGNPTNVGSTGTLTLPSISSIPILGGLLSGSTFLGSLIPALDASKITTGTFAQGQVSGLPSLFTDVLNIPKNMFNSWFGGTTATGTPAEVATTVAAIRTAVAGGYTLQTFTSSNASWSVPAGLAGAAEAYAVAVGGGGKGVTANSATPGAGGSSGGYTSERIDPSALAATLAVTVGAGGSSSGADGGQSKVMSGATTLVKSITNEGNAASIQGYVPSSSNPGRGGVGGQASSNAALVNGADGESTAVATGGAGGTGTTSSGGTASAGGVGGAGQTSLLPICGGGGGGGGGGKNSAFAGGAVGGNGGFPGGGSGGGGGGGGGINTAGGTAANGLVALIWK